MNPLVDRIKVPFIVIIFFFLCLFLFVKVFGPIPFDVASTSNQVNPFSVQGTGKVDVIPQTAMVSLGVTASSKTVKDAQNQVNSSANSIITELKKMGIQDKDIKTTNYSEYPTVNPVIRQPVFDQSNGSTGAGVAQSGPVTTDNIIIKPYPVSPAPVNGISGYTVSENLEVTLQNADNANKVIDIATAHGATNLGGVQFTLSDEQQKKAEEEARTKAITDAKDKAQSISQAAGIRLGKVINIDVQNNGYPIFYAQKGMAGGGGVTDQSTNVQPGQNTITVNVTLSYQTY